MANKLPGFGPMVECACGRCGKKRRQFDASGRERKYIQGHERKKFWAEYKKKEEARHG